MISIEGQPWQGLLTWLALVGSLYCIRGGERALTCWRKQREAVGQRLWVSFRRKQPNRVWILNRTALELAAFGHVVMTPPWFFWSYGDFFPGLCTIGIAAGVMRLLNDRLGRAI